jgi:formate hydrogenlyase subunit 6/NADH:ubiquinone oxidoreductase subunit I
MVPSEHTRTGQRPVIDLGECIFCGLCEEACRYDALFLTDYIELSAFESDEMIIYEKEPSKEQEPSVEEEESQEEES